MNIKAAIFIFGVLSGMTQIVACGKKGPLYLPEAEVEAVKTDIENKAKKATSRPEQTSHGVQSIPASVE